MKDRIKVLYLAGTGRNGGTLFDRIFGGASRCLSLGEFRFVWTKGLINNELCGCGKPFRSCEFWSEVFTRAFGGVDKINPYEIEQIAQSVDRTRLVPIHLSPFQSKGFKARLSEYRSVLARLFRAIAEVSGAEMIVDSSKFAGYGLVLAGISEIELNVIHIVRDCRATAFSWQKKKEELPGKPMPTYHPGISAFQWVYRNLACESLQGKAHSYERLTYETIMNEPKAILERSAKRIGIGSELPFVDSHSVLLGLSHTQSGNPNRFKQGKIDLWLDDEWKNGLAPRLKLLTSVIGLPLLIRYRLPIVAK